MRWRRVTLLVVVGLLVSGLLTFALAHKPPTKGPPRPPEQWGDPDWPAYCTIDGDRVQRVVAYGDESSIQSQRLAAEEIRPRSTAPLRRRQVSLYRKCEIVILGRTIVVRR